MASKNNATPESAAAQAAEEKVVVPPQQSVEITKEGVTLVEEKTGSAEPTTDEGDKKSFKDRLVETAKAMKSNKKLLVMLGASAGVAALSYRRYLQKLAEAQETPEENTESSDESTV